VLSIGVLQRIWWKPGENARQIHQLAGFQSFNDEGEGMGGEKRKGLKRGCYQDNVSYGNEPRHRSCAPRQIKKQTLGTAQNKEKEKVSSQQVIYHLIIHGVERGGREGILSYKPCSTKNEMRGNGELKTNQKSLDALPGQVHAVWDRERMGKKKEDGRQWYRSFLNNRLRSTRRAEKDGEVVLRSSYSISRNELVGNGVLGGGSIEAGRKSVYASKGGLS